MKANLILFYIFIAISLCSSCAMQPLQYMRVDNLKVAKLNINPELNMELVFFNPNDLGCTLQAVDLKIVSESNDTVATVILQDKIKLPSATEFKVPITCTVATGKLLKNSLSSLINGDDIPVTYIGTVTVSKFIFKKTYIFTSKEKFNINQLIKL